MWLSLTTAGNNANVLVDFDKVLQVIAHDRGTQIHFAPTLPSRDGVMTSKLLYVQESIASIARALKARPVD